jgi:adenosylmethionine-8-amino-7-oxononanoate aminotransferase
MDGASFDRQHIWHPYSRINPSTPIFTVSSAHGVYLHLDDGRKLVDGMSSWWAAIHGYNHPKLNQALETQLADMSHVMFGGLTHEPAIELGRRLLDLTDDRLETIFFADSGSVAVEVALKMAIQFQSAINKPERQRFIALRNGYHGDTTGGMSVSDPENGMHQLFAHSLPQQLFADAPQCRPEDSWDMGDIKTLENLLERHHGEVAAVILEPMVQGAGGMRFYHPEYLVQARRLCDEYGALLIFDEIATGFGRTGSLFAYEQANVVPDILCLGKALTGGYMTMAATLATGNVAQAIADGEPGVFMHGPTFMANPLACAVSIASLDLLIESPWKQRVSAIEQQLKSELAPCRELSNVADVRIKGAIGVVELEHPVDMALMPEEFVKRNVWVRPFNRLVYLMPPYIIEPEQLSQLTRAVFEVIALSNKERK